LAGPAKPPCKYYEYNSNKSLALFLCVLIRLQHLRQSKATLVAGLTRGGAVATIVQIGRERVWLA